MKIRGKDYVYYRLFKNEQRDDRGVARVLFDDIPNFGIKYLPPHAIGNKTVGEIWIWSNVSEPQTPEVAVDEPNPDEFDADENTDVSDDYGLSSGESDDDIFYY